MQYGHTHNRQSSGFDDLRKLLCYVRCHIVILCVFWVRGIQIETRACTKVPIVIFTFNARSTGRCVGKQDRYALRRSRTKESTFLSTVTVSVSYPSVIFRLCISPIVFGAGQTCKIQKHRYFCFSTYSRKEDVELSIETAKGIRLSTF